MTEEERREMMRSNYAAQMEMLGYDASGNPLDDIVRVVRCKDCKYWDGCGKCRINNGYHSWVKDDWFCADGKRRNDDA